MSAAKGLPTDINASIPVAIPISGLVPANVVPTNTVTTVTTPTDPAAPDSTSTNSLLVPKMPEPSPTNLTNVSQVDGMNDLLDSTDSSKMDTLIPTKNKFISNSQLDGFSLWHDVTICNTTSFIVSEYSLNSSNSVTSTTSSLNATEESTSIKKQLEPGTAYKFRVAGINACGRGPWSEVSAFLTCMPGFPGAPSAIKISKVSS